MSPTSAFRLKGIRENSENKNSVKVINLKNEIKTNKTEQSFFSNFRDIFSSIRKKPFINMASVIIIFLSAILGFRTYLNNEEITTYVFYAFVLVVLFGLYVYEDFRYSTNEEETESITKGKRSTELLPELISKLTSAIKLSDRNAVEALVLQITDISPELAPYLDELVADELLNSKVLDFTRVLAQPTIFAKAA